MHELVAELERVVDRMKYYGESPSLETLESLKQEASDLEDSIHDECLNECHLDELRNEADTLKEENGHLEDLVSDLKQEVERFEKMKSTQTKQKLMTKIMLLESRVEELEGKLSDANADIAVYKARIAKGAVSARLAEDFIFSPEEARAQFKVIGGGP